MTQADSQMILQPVQYFNLIIGKIPLPGRPVENDFPQQFPFVGQDDATIKLDIVGDRKAVRTSETASVACSSGVTRSLLR